MSTVMTPLVARRALADYARRPLNLVLLVAVPVVIVFVWGGSLAQFAKLLGGSADRAQMEAVSAGWAAAMLAGLAGFFQVSGSRAADHRLAAAGGRTASVVAGRLGASLALAVLAAAGGLGALAARGGITDLPRALSATLLVAVIYVALGVLVGTLVRSDMNGALIISLVWAFDVFFGPGLGPSRLALTRLFPLHFPTLVLIGQASGHAGPIGDVGWALIWAVGLSGLAVARLASATRPAPAPHRAAGTTVDVAPVVVAVTRPAATATPATLRLVVHRGEVVVAGPAPAFPATVHRVATAARLRSGLRAGMREYRRNRVLWALLAVVPALFIVAAWAVTPDKLGPVALDEGSRHFTVLLSMQRVHAGEMAAVATAFLAGITGLFVVTGSAGSDRRLVLAGFRPREVLAGRLGVIGAATVLTTTVAVAVSCGLVPPRQWAEFTVANLLIGLTYAMVGVLIGPITGRLGGLYLILVLAFIDTGFGQTVMFHPVPPTWGTFLPARGASRMLLDGAFTTHFDQLGNLMLGVAWLAALTAATVVVFQRRTGSKRPPAPSPVPTDKLGTLPHPASVAQPDATRPGRTDNDTMPAPHDHQVGSPEGHEDHCPVCDATPRVLVAISHPAMRALTLELLENEFGCWAAGILGDDELLAETIRRNHPDLVIVDAGDFPACCRVTLRRFPPEKVIVVGPEPDVSYRAAALAGGAGAWIPRDRVGDDLASEMRRVLGCIHSPCPPGARTAPSRRPLRTAHA